MAAIPRMIYGTAWKKEMTTELVKQAVRAGFRAVDTAAQRKHYRQDLAGQAIATLIKEDGLKREDLFIQTKFTSIGGQDASGFIPYDTRAKLQEQVVSSFENSLEELQTTYIDSLLLHSPENSVARTAEALVALKTFITSKQLRYVGISNIYDLSSLQGVQKALEKHDMRISFIQNRFYSATGYDEAIREWCKSSDIVYQSFWTLTANPHALRDKANTSAARRIGATVEQTFYQFCIQEGITPLNGTTSSEHMKLGVQVLSGQIGPLTDDEMQAIRSSLV